MAVTEPLSILWIGLLLGVSFLATPAKFRAESITLPVALDVGRVTFKLFSRVEAVLGLVVLLSAFDFSDGQFRANVITLSIVVGAIVAFQTLWVRPVLDRRVLVLIAGGDVPRSKAHALYVALEVAKLIALAAIAISS